MSRYDPPDPKCRHARRGIVTAGDYRTGPHAATNVCDRPDCIADAIEWAEAVTHLAAEHRPDRKPAEQQSLLGSS